MQKEIDWLLMEIQQASYSERRTEPRQNLVRPIKIHRRQEKPILAFSKDLSSQGMGTIVDVPFESGTLATVEIHCMTGEPIYLRCEVRWCDAYGSGWYQVGWKFIGTGQRPVPQPSQEFTAQPT
jgi:PilZ domain